jgi:hypothetical protein
MGGALLLLDGTLEQWLRASTLHRVLWLGGLVIGGAAVYFGSLLAMGVRPGQFRLLASRH